ncbi:unnamed protein product, partial [Ixodes pacificus]
WPTCATYGSEHAETNTYAETVAPWWPLGASPVLRRTSTTGRLTSTRGLRACRRHRRPRPPRRLQPFGSPACAAAATGVGGQKPASSWRASPKRGVQCRARRRARPCGAVCGAVLGPRVVGRRRTLRFGPP